VAKRSSNGTWYLLRLGFLFCTLPSLAPALPLEDRPKDDGANHEGCDPHRHHADRQCCHERQVLPPCVMPFLIWVAKALSFVAMAWRQSTSRIPQDRRGYFNVGREPDRSVRRRPNGDCSEHRLSGDNGDKCAGKGCGSGQRQVDAHAGCSAMGEASPRRFAAIGVIDRRSAKDQLFQSCQIASSAACN
jgi:hypothetical protein